MPQRSVKFNEEFDNEVKVEVKLKYKYGAR